MAGNKALKKFEKSKIPKKGTGPSVKEINIYKEPNTHSEIIGKIKAGESINWINKSICDNREWIRCDKNQNFGYIISTEEDGNYNFDVDKITSKNPEKKTETFITTTNNSTTVLTKEDLQKGEEALNEILNEDCFKTNFEEDINEKSTEGENSSFENTINYKDELNLDNFNDFDFSNVDFDMANDFHSKLNEQIINEIFTEVEKDGKPKPLILPKIEENTEKKEEESSTFKRSLSALADILPGVGQIKAGYEIIFGNDLITNEKLDLKERLMKALDLIPGLNSINNGKKISKVLTICNKGNKGSKPSKVVKASKNIARKTEKTNSDAKKGEKKNNTDNKKDEVTPEDMKEYEKKIEFPENYSQHDNKRNAFRQLKKDLKIPLSSQPIKTKRNKDRRGNSQPGKIYEFKNYDKNIDKKTVEIRDDRMGHHFSDKDIYIPPHLNGPKGYEKHLIYKTNLEKVVKYYKDKNKYNNKTT